MKDRISEITQRWFLSEEALFLAYCTHRLAENSTMKCEMRVGKGMIEVNPRLCADLTDKALEERLRIEVIRILLKHPYDRQPDGCCNAARALGSNCVIGDSYKLRTMIIETPADFNLPRNGHYEFYARQIQKMMSKMHASGEGDSNDDGEIGDEDNGDLAANWQQDELWSAQINETIKNVNAWGSLPGNIVEQIIASTKARIDYRKVLAGFRATVLSQARQLTRMRPNRRAGFDAMGSRYDFTTSIIIGVDVSGSISREDLQHFYTTINRFFQYGIQQIDVVQFDTQIGKVQTMSKAMENIEVTGRGGTCFQPFIDYVAKHPEYDGAIIYTDGYAPQPRIPASMRTPLCWVVRNMQQLNAHECWMKESGHVCVIENT